MRYIALSVFLLSTWLSRPVYADRCILDSDCPTGSVCNSGGGCEVPTSQSSGGGNNKTTVLGAVVVIALVGLLILSLTWHPDTTARTTLPPLDHAPPTPEPGGLTFRF